jgi:hypothetical protein
MSIHVFIDDSDNYSHNYSRENEKENNRWVTC